jgi:hypothetical protein
MPKPREFFKYTAAKNHEFRRRFVLYPLYLIPKLSHITHSTLLSRLTQNLLIGFVKSQYIFDKVMIYIITVGQLPYLFQSDFVRHQQWIRRSNSLVLTYRTSSHYVHNTLACGEYHPSVQNWLYTANISLCALPHNWVPSTAKHITFHPTFTPSLHIHYPAPRVLSQPLQNAQGGQHSTIWHKQSPCR